MTKGRKRYNVFQLSSAVLMLIALLWLTVSAPFVYAAQQELTKARSDYLSAVADFNKSQFLLQKVVGNPVQSDRAAGTDRPP